MYTDISRQTLQDIQIQYDVKKEGLYTAGLIAKISHDNIYYLIMAYKELLQEGVVDESMTSFVVNAVSRCKNLISWYELWLSDLKYYEFKLEHYDTIVTL